VEPVSLPFLGTSLEETTNSELLVTTFSMLITTPTDKLLGDLSLKTLMLNLTLPLKSLPLDNSGSEFKLLVLALLDFGLPLF
jgi:hypothetical protein